jgi:hypothetical protein
VGKNPAQLNRRQVEVLTWIGSGCPAGVYDDGYEHRIVARALAHRGLVTVTGHGGSWTAKITGAGLARTAALPAAEATTREPVPAHNGHGTRAARLAAAIMAEAAHRGLEARAGNGKLAIRTAAGSYVIRLREAPGRLVLVLDGPGADGLRFGDTESGTLEERLPELFGLLESRAQHRRRRIEEKRNAAAQARTRRAEQAVWQQFVRRSREWQAVNQHRAFLAAARDAAAAYTGPDRDELVAALDVAGRLLDELDPVRHPHLLVPELPDHDDLAALPGGVRPRLPAGRTGPPSEPPG